MRHHASSVRSAASVSPASTCSGPLRDPVSTIRHPPGCRNRSCDAGLTAGEASPGRKRGERPMETTRRGARDPSAAEAFHRPWPRVRAYLIVCDRAVGHGTGRRASPEAMVRPPRAARSLQALRRGRRIPAPGRFHRALPTEGVVRQSVLGGTAVQVPPSKTIRPLSRRAISAKSGEQECSTSVQITSASGAVQQSLHIVDRPGPAASRRAQVGEPPRGQNTPAQAPASRARCMIASDGASRMSSVRGLNE